jgi:hypothetical protein
MAATTTMRRAASAPARVRMYRALGVAAATAAALTVWAVAVPLLGLDLLVRFGSGAPQSVGVGLVLGAGLVASLFGWGLLVILQRRSAHYRTIWTGVAVVALLVSLGLPLSAGTTTSTKIALALMHIAAAAVLIPTLRQSAG